MSAKRSRTLSLSGTQLSVVPSTQSSMRGSRVSRKGSASARKYNFNKVYRIVQPVQYFMRKQYYPGFFSASAGGGSGFAFNFRLQDLPVFGEFTQLFDQYMIRGIEFEIIPRITQAVVQTPNSIGNVWSVLDYDDSVSPANVQELMQYQNVQRTQMTQVHKRMLVPAIRGNAFSSAGTAYTPKKKQWIDLSDPGTEHYGVKVWVDGLGAGAPAIEFDIVTTYHLAMKNVR